MVFQSLALFPHRTVGQNIEFSMKMKGIAPPVREKRARELMAQLRLPDSYYTKNVTKCSGGERQRVALARALAYEPDILFFDEPLSAIDYKLRKTLEKELKDIHRETGKTFIYITHSLEEAMVMSDRIGVMRSGKLVQVGSPQEIYSAPRTKFVSEFIGDVNIVAVKADGKDQVQSDLGRFKTLPVPDGVNDAYVVVRPAGRCRQQPRGGSLQRVRSRLPRPVSGACRRPCLHRRKASAAGFRRQARRQGADRLGCC
jgi:spermidine/putrescine transport system ATP-binding protein